MKNERNERYQLVAYVIWKKRLLETHSFFEWGKKHDETFGTFKRVLSNFM